MTPAVAQHSFQVTGSAAKLCGGASRPAPLLPRACRSAKAGTLACPRARRRATPVLAVYAADSSASGFSSGEDARLDLGSSFGESSRQQQQQAAELPRFMWWLPSREDEEQVLSGALNVGFLAFAGAAIVAHIASNDSSLWELYLSAVSTNPVATKAAISGVVYSLGDIMAQSYEGRSVAEWDRARVLRSGLCGFLAHGPLSHFYYLALDNMFTQLELPSSEWVTPLLKMGVDQTAWSLFWNTTYYVLLGALKLESPATIAATVRNTWWDLLKAGWRLWPFVHVVTYGLMPVQHRLLFVDAVELVWVTILSLYGQQQRQALQEEGMVGPVACALPGADGEGGDPAEEILRGMQVEHEIVFEDQYGHQVSVSPEELYSHPSLVPFMATEQHQPPAPPQPQQHL